MARSGVLPSGQDGIEEIETALMPPVGVLMQVPRCSKVGDSERGLLQ